MSASPTVPLRVALDTALQTSTLLVGDKVYLEGSHKLRGAALPYIVIATGTEVPDDRYNAQRGHENTTQLKCWGNDKHQAELVYAELKAKVDGVTLTVAGHGVSRGRIEKLADFAEPNAEVTGHVVVARYRNTSQVAA